jgi:hypothetical protein
MCANRQTTRCNIWQRLCVMEDLLQHIDLDYYRSARLLIVRAEIAQLRKGVSASPSVEPSHPVDHTNQNSRDAADARLEQLG